MKSENANLSKFRAEAAGLFFIEIFSFANETEERIGDQNERTRKNDEVCFDAQFTEIFPAAFFFQHNMQYRRTDNTPYQLSGGIERLPTAVHTGI